MLALSPRPSMGQPLVHAVCVDVMAMDAALLEATPQFILVTSSPLALSASMWMQRCNCFATKAWGFSAIWTTWSSLPGQRNGRCFTHLTSHPASFSVGFCDQLQEEQWKSYGEAVDPWCGHCCSLPQLTQFPLGSCTCTACTDGLRLDPKRYKRSLVTIPHSVQENACFQGSISMYTYEKYFTWPLLYYTELCEHWTLLAWNEPQYTHNKFQFCFNNKKNYTWLI